MELENAALWWAGKELMRGKKLMDFVGKNEKTKIICKIQKVSLNFLKKLKISFANTASDEYPGNRGVPDSSDTLR